MLTLVAQRGVKIMQKIKSTFTAACFEKQILLKSVTETHRDVYASNPMSASEPPEDESEDETDSLSFSLVLAQMDAEISQTHKRHSRESGVWDNMLDLMRRTNEGSSAFLEAAEAAKAATAASNRKEARNRVGVRKFDISVMQTMSGCRSCQARTHGSSVPSSPGSPTCSTCWYILGGT